MIALVLLGCAAPLGVEGEAREKAGQAGDWQAGDAIDGWEDYDCGLLSGADVATVAYPSVPGAQFAFGREDGGEAIVMTLELADCEELECVPGDVDPGEAARISANVRDPYRTFRGALGWYVDSPDREDDHISSDGYGPLGWFNPELNREPPTVEVCISRLRPDMIRGVIAARFENQLLAHLYVDALQLYYTFEYRYVPHCAFDMSTSRDDMVIPDGCYSSQAYIYSAYEGTNYDDVWDWDAIVDPAVRDALYTQYTPANWE